MKGHAQDCATTSPPHLLKASRIDEYPRVQPCMTLAVRRRRFLKLGWVREAVQSGCRQRSAFAVHRGELAV